MANKCLDCKLSKVETGFFMLKDDLWASIRPEIWGMLCIDCIEIRLGRKLTIKDFQPHSKKGGLWHNFWRRNYKKRHDVNVILEFLRLMWE